MPLRPVSTILGILVLSSVHAVVFASTCEESLLQRSQFNIFHFPNNSVAQENEVSPLLIEYSDRAHLLIREGSTPQALIKNAEFCADPSSYPGMFTRHDLGHPEEVAISTIEAIDAVNGILIDRKSAESLNFMKAEGTAIAYLHDTGMADLSAYGRRMHPERAAQAIFTSEFDPILQSTLLSSQPLVARVRAIAEILNQVPETVLREFFSLSAAHSKSKFPSTLLDEPDSFRRAIQDALQFDLKYLDLKQRLKKAEKTGNLEQVESLQNQLLPFRYGPEANTNLPAYYKDFRQDSFKWLDSKWIQDQPQRIRKILDANRDDLLDTVRCLRAGDAMRDRGLTLQGGNNSEIYYNPRSGDVEIKLHTEQGDVRFQSDNIPVMGESLIGNVKYSPIGDLVIELVPLKISKKRERSVDAVSLAIADIASDMLSSFHSGNQSRIEIRGFSEDPEFAFKVRRALISRDAQYSNRVEVSRSTADLENLRRSASLRAEEFERFFKSEPNQMMLEEKKRLVDQLKSHGMNVSKVDPTKAFEKTRMVLISRGENLFEQGSPADFVYIPLDHTQLFARHIGRGNVDFPISPFTLVGESSALQGTLRRWRVRASSDSRVLAIPKDVYLKYFDEIDSSSQIVQSLRKLVK